MVLYDVFVAFVGLNNISYAEYRIWIGLVIPIPRSSRKCQYRSDTNTKYRIGALLNLTVALKTDYSQTLKNPSSQDYDHLILKHSPHNISASCYFKIVLRLNTDWKS